MSDKINDETIESNIDYIKKFLDFLIGDRARLVNIIQLLMIEFGKYDVDINVKELMEITKGTSLTYKYLDQELGYENIRLKVKMYFSDEQRENIEKDFE